MRSVADHVLPFIQESNRIEGIYREVLPEEFRAHVAFLALPEIAVADVEAFVLAVAGAPLRRAAGQNVRVGSHRPPPGGPDVEAELKALLVVANGDAWTPFDTPRRQRQLTRRDTQPARRCFSHDQVAAVIETPKGALA